MKILFVADFFHHEIVGGAELVDHVLITRLEEIGNKVIKQHSRQFDFKTAMECDGIIVSNFTMLTDLDLFIERFSGKYVIFEHDHKYLQNRDPSTFKNYEAPLSRIINRDFYRNANAVFCQTKKHHEVLRKNLRINNAFNLGGSLWFPGDLDYIDFLSKTKKPLHNHVVVDSSNPIKGTHRAVQYCKNNNLEHKLIGSKDYREFLFQLSQGESLVFLPEVLETCNRLCVEAKMLGLKVITTEKTGATSEEWFKQDSKSIIKHNKQQLENVPKIVEKFLTQRHEDFQIPMTSLLTSCYNGMKYVEGFCDWILAQTSKDRLEVVVVDANSPQQEWKRIKERLEGKVELKIINLDQDPGIYGCWNIALDNSSGEFVSNANLDDRRTRDNVEIQAIELFLSGDCDLVYSRNKCTFEHPDSGKPMIEYPTREFSKAAMVKCLPGPMPMWRKARHEAIGGFRSDLKSAGDWEFWLRMVENGSKFKFIDKVLGVYYHNPNGMSTKPENMKAKYEEEKGVFEKYRHIFGDDVDNNVLSYFGVKK